MFIVWTRQGFVGLLLPILISVAGMAISDGMFGKGYFSSNAIFGLCFFVSSPVIWFLGKKLNSGEEKRLIDPETNQVVILKNKHTIFWMPLEYFSIITAVLGVFWMLSK